MNNNIGPSRFRCKKGRRGECIINNEGDIRLFGDIGDGRNIGHIHLGIADGFDKYQFRIFGYRFFELFGQTGIYKGCFYAEPCQGVLKQRDGASEYSGSCH